MNWPGMIFLLLLIAGCNRSSPPLPPLSTSADRQSSCRAGLRNKKHVIQPDADGLIHHPIYGTYPSKIPFEEGMTLMPGQGTIVTFEVSLPLGTLKTICFRDGGTGDDCAKYN